MVTGATFQGVNHGRLVVQQKAAAVFADNECDVALAANDEFSVFVFAGSWRDALSECSRANMRIEAFPG